MPSKQPNGETPSELRRRITQLQKRVLQLETHNSSLVMNSKQQRLLLDMVVKMLKQAIDERNQLAREKETE